MIDIPRSASLCIEEEVIQTSAIGSATSRSSSILQLRLMEKVSELSVGRRADGKFKKVYATIYDSKERKIYSGSVTTTAQNIDIDALSDESFGKKKTGEAEKFHGAGDGYDTYRICFSNRGSSDKERVEFKVAYERKGAGQESESQKEATLSQESSHDTNSEMQKGVFEGKSDLILQNQDNFLLDSKQGKDLEISTLIKSKEKDQRVHISLKPVQEQFYEIENWMLSTTQEFNSVRSREQYLQKMSSVMDSRVKWFSIFSIIVLLSVSMWQILYLRAYFQSKKLL